MEDSQTEMERITNTIENKYIGIEPMLLIAVIAIIIIYYYIFSSLGNNEDGSASTFKVLFETFLWGLFIFLLLLNGVSYIFGIDLIKTLKSFFGYEEEIIIPVEDNGFKPRIMLKEQVFHLPENKYNFEDSKAICKAYGARLASYEEINDAYKKGADWCTYGWSKDQMALYPTQKEKWEKLQTLKGHEQDCGRPGINGGYINDGEMKYGVNCYGAKPSITPDEAEQMRKKPFYHKNMKEIQFDNKVKYWRNHLSEIEMAPFNHDNWSMI